LLDPHQPRQRFLDQLTPAALLPCGRRRARWPARCCGRLRGCVGVARGELLRFIRAWRRPGGWRSPVARAKGKAKRCCRQYVSALARYAAALGPLELGPVSLVRLGAGPRPLQRTGLWMAASEPCRFTAVALQFAPLALPRGAAEPPSSNFEIRCAQPRTRSKDRKVPLMAVAARPDGAARCHRTRGRRPVGQLLPAYHSRVAQSHGGKWFKAAARGKAFAARLGTSTRPGWIGKVSAHLLTCRRRSWASSARAARA